MPKFDFRVLCTDSLRNTFPATYKVAAEWNGGGYTELKTYGFADDECLERVFERALGRISKVRCDEGETVGSMRIYILEPKKHDPELKRAIHLDQALLAKFGNPIPDRSVLELPEE